MLRFSAIAILISLIASAAQSQSVIENNTSGPIGFFTYSSTDYIPVTADTPQRPGSPAGQGVVPPDATVEFSYTGLASPYTVIDPASMFLGQTFAAGSGTYTGTNTSTGYYTDLMSLFPDPGGNTYASFVLTVTKPNLGNPTAISATLDEFTCDRITVTFDQKISNGMGGFMPDTPTNMALTVAGAPVTISSFSGDLVASTGTAFFFAPVSPGDEVVLTYTQGGSDKLVNANLDEGEDFEFTGVCGTNAMTLADNSPVGGDETSPEATDAEAELQQVVAQETTTRAQFAMSGNRRMTNNARLRFERRLGGVEVTQSKPFSFMSSIFGDDQAVNGTGEFSWAGSRGSSRHFAYGDFQFATRDGTTSGAANLRYVIETDRPDAIDGLAFGLSAGSSNVGGAYTGTNRLFAASVAAYRVARVGDGAIADGYVGFEIGRGTLNVNDGSDAFTGKYSANTVSFGASYSKEMQFKGMSFNGLIAFDLAITNQPSFDLTSDTAADRAIGAQQSAIASLKIAPQFDWENVMKGTQTRVTPGIRCEQVTSNTDGTIANCGLGISLDYTNALSSHSTLTLQVSAEQLGSSTNGDLRIAFERKF